jgi:hypothetical protein
MPKIAEKNLTNFGTGDTDVGTRTLCLSGTMDVVLYSRLFQLHQLLFLRKQTEREPRESDVLRKGTILRMHRLIDTNFFLMQIYRRKLNRIICITL